MVQASFGLRRLMEEEECFLWCRSPFGWLSAKRLRSDELFICKCNGCLILEGWFRFAESFHFLFSFSCFKVQIFGFMNSNFREGGRSILFWFIAYCLSNFFQLKLKMVKRREFCFLGIWVRKFRRRLAVVGRSQTQK